MPEIATIGYEDAPPSLFLRSLQEAGIVRVIDVRALANSRRPGYAKRALSASLDGAGIAYSHLPALGTPKAGREAAHRGDVAGLRRIYGAHLATGEAEAALALAAELGREAPCCLLCLEADPARCHRTQIAEALQARWGFGVRHLCGSAPPAQR